MSVIKSPPKSVKAGDLHRIISKFPARQKQIIQLASLFGEPEEFAYPCIFIYGLSGTGKSAVLKMLLSDLNHCHAWINCVEAYSQRLLLESVLNQISGVIPGPDNDFEGYGTCLNMCDFVRLLINILVEKDLTDETVYIILDNAERLRDMPPAILAALLRLQDIMKQNICVILISEIIWDKFRNGFSFYEPYQISFPEYTKEETISILEQDCPDECNRDFYRHYLNLVMSVFHMVTRNLLELRHIALTNFPIYFEPVKSEESTEKDVRKLWRNIEPHLKKSLNTVYLRETSLYDNTTIKNQKEKPIYDIRANVELPFFSKFLLISAYIASYNPPASDKRFFLKNTGKTYKRKAGHRKTAPVNQHQKGPKAFPLTRLLSIFYVIVDEKVSPSVTLMSQISNLVTLRLLEVKVGKDHPLTAAKYKCLVNLDFITSVASTVRFDISGYLFDFV